MPIAPAMLFQKVGLSLAGTVPWGQSPSTDQPGVYAISLCSDPSSNGGLLPRAPIEIEKVQAWISRVPTFCYRGQMSPQPTVVAAFLNEFWIDDESIVYIGKATCLRKRLDQFRRHKLGNRSPHAGGHWIKTLANLGDLFIHYCICPTADAAESKEDEALALFKGQVSQRCRCALHNPIPFANRAHPPGVSKQKAICDDVLP